MAGIPEAAGTGGVFSSGSHKGFKSQLKKVYTFYTKLNDGNAAVYGGDFKSFAVGVRHNF